LSQGALGRHQVGLEKGRKAAASVGARKPGRDAVRVVLSAIEFPRARKLQPGDRMRFTPAHELGHIIMHRFPTPNMEPEGTSLRRAS
jgi:hypothetical protein